MKSERGVTLTSLAIYIIVATLVVSTMALLSSHTFLNMKILKDQATYAVEYNKFNMFFIEDVKSNKTANVTYTQITFTDGNKYEYKDKSIYRNEKKIAKDVETCTFTAGTYTIKNTTKNLITVNLKIGTGEKKYQKEIEYVLRYW